jgi:hypothetical protein
MSAERICIPSFWHVKLYWCVKRTSTPFPAIRIATRIRPCPELLYGAAACVHVDAFDLESVVAAVVSVFDEDDDGDSVQKSTKLWISNGPTNVTPTFTSAKNAVYKILPQKQLHSVCRTVVS